MENTMDNTQIKDFALRFLNEKENITAVIGTSTKEGMPHAAVIYYYVDEVFTFYFLTVTNTQKYKDLMENPNVSLAVGFGPAYITIQGQGTAEVISKGSEEENRTIVKINNRLREKDRHWPVFQIPDLEKEEISVFKIMPHTLRLLNLNLNEENCFATFKDDFQQII